MVRSLFNRGQVAKQLGVTAKTVARWEKSGKSPVRPRRLKRNGRPRYTQEDVRALLSWINEFEDVATLGGNDGW